MKIRNPQFEIRNSVNVITPGPDFALAEEPHPGSGSPSPLGVDLGEGNIILISSIGHFLCHLAETIYPAVMIAVMLEFATLDELTAGFLVTLGYILLGVGALPVGLWTDAWGPLRVCRVYFIVLAVAGLLVALSPTVWALFMTLTLLGLAASIYHPVGLAMISLGVRARGRAMGLNGIAGNFGIALGPTLGVGLFALGSAVGQPGLWRLAYVVVALLSLVALVYFQWILKRAGVSLRRERPTISTHLSQTVTNPQPQAAPARAWASFLPLVLLYMAMIFGGLNYRVLMTSLPLYLSGGQAVVQEPASATSNNSSSGQVGQAPETGTASQNARGVFSVFIALIVGAIGQYVGGRLADRYGARNVYPLLIILILPLGILVGLLEGADMLLLFASLMAVCLFAQQPVENSVMAEQTSRARQGLSYASKFTLTFGIGALGTPIAALILSHYGSYAPAFFFIAGSATLMALLAVIALGLSRRFNPVS